VNNTTRIWAHRAGIAAALKDLHGAIAGSGLVPDALVSLVRLRVAQIHGCPF
jgi:hypothetical protein